MKNNSKEILVIGAFDRYNYGDLLFPYIVENQFKNYDPSVGLKYFGLIKSDLSKVGGKPTDSIKSFYKYCNTDKDRQIIVVIAGGETIQATWRGLYASISYIFNFAIRKFNRYDKILSYDCLAKTMVGGKTDLPFTFSKTDFKYVDFVIGNSLGGSAIKSNFFNAKRTKTLREIDVLNVRDMETLKILKEHNIPSNLIPDSAILMSKVFKKDALKNKVNNSILEFIKQDEYIFFQINNSSFKSNEAEIIQELENCYKKSSYKICLCPIGKALAHDDQKALANINRSINVPHSLFNEVSIWDIMYLIAMAKCYIGTSLHGAITAMSFKVPYIGLNKGISKLDNYIKTWGVTELEGSVDINSFSCRFETALAIKQEELAMSLNNQVSILEESFRNLLNLITE